jgi:hypothetical protein
MSNDEAPIFLGDQIFVRDAARSFSALEQSVRERATAAGADDIEGVTRRTMHRLMMFARCVAEVDGAKGYWLEVDREDRSFEAGRRAVPALDRKHPVGT